MKPTDSGDGIVPHADLRSEPAGKSKHRTRADEVIDAVQGVKQTQNQRVCPKCEGTSFTKRRPLGRGVILYVCRGCRHKMPGPSASLGPLIQATGTHDQGKGGAYYRGRTSPPKQDPNLPTFRGKSRKKR